MMKKLLTAVFAVAALVVVTPSAEARWGKRSCGTKSCAPKSCEKPCAPQCTTDVEIVDYKYFPCCRTEIVPGYKKCPVKRTTKCCTTEAVKCCPEEMSCCYFPEVEGFNQPELDQANGKSAAMNNDMVESNRGSRAQRGTMRGGARAQRGVARNAARDEASDIVE